MGRDLAPKLSQPKDLFVVLLVFLLGFEPCTGRISIVSAQMPVLTSGHPLPLALALACVEWAVPRRAREESECKSHGWCLHIKESKWPIVLSSPLGKNGWQSKGQMCRPSHVREWSRMWSSPPALWCLWPASSKPPLNLWTSPQTKALFIIN